MPMINSKITLPITQQQRDELKTKLGKAISILNKPESYLMLGFEDNYDLYFGGTKLEKGAYVTVDMLGAEDGNACNKMTAKICKIFNEVLAIPGDAIYISYAGYKNWGWNGSNF